ncbi:hypothetical protein D9611_006984 [Ephemerocybe angulata]|uniref:MYND-type domain-containing protein n=1 Tax=Ephemerocybe angulata TaxID=980116 RepID=A0A8H5B0A7_9AGAR|nr:hypothetical protein D9611_006984 [Tulosesus angulatus]
MSSEDLKLILTVFTYGPHQSRAEIELRPSIPKSARGNPAKINAWLQGMSLTMAADFKFTNDWHCEICDKPARESKYNVASWTHLAQPRAVFYIHHLCAAGNNRCHNIIKLQDAQMSRIAGGGSQNPHEELLAMMGSLSTDEDEVPEGGFPLASSCANCNDEKTGKKGFKLFRCGSCKLTRYCCPGCQKQDWARHKKTCKIVESVKWVDWPTKA